MGKAGTDAQEERIQLPDDKSDYEFRSIIFITALKEVYILTFTPSYYCTDSPPQIQVFITEVGLKSSDQAIVKYQVWGCNYQAILRNFDGVWKITSQSITQYCGGG